MGTMSLPTVPGSGFLAFALACASRLAATARLWGGRMADRRRLALLDEHLLRDIGLSPERARAEAAKRPWQS